MFAKINKKIMLITSLISGSIIAAAPILSLTTNLNQTNNKYKISDYDAIKYNDKIYANIDLAVKDLLGSNDIVDYKNFIGDISKAIMLADEFNKVDIKKLHEYDGSELFKAYKKKDGEYTDDILLAKLSRIGNIETRYSDYNGGYFINEEQAKESIVKKAIPDALPYYEIEDAYNEQNGVAFRFNPLNKKDQLEFKKLAIKNAFKKYASLNKTRTNTLNNLNDFNIEKYISISTKKHKESYMVPHKSIFKSKIKENREYIFSRIAEILTNQLYNQDNIKYSINFEGINDPEKISLNKQYTLLPFPIGIPTFRTANVSYKLSKNNFSDISIHKIKDSNVFLKKDLLNQFSTSHLITEDSPYHYNNPWAMQYSVKDLYGNSNNDFDISYSGHTPNWFFSSFDGLDIDVLSGGSGSNLQFNFVITVDDIISYKSKLDRYFTNNDNLRKDIFNLFVNLLFVDNTEVKEELLINDIEEIKQLREGLTNYSSFMNPDNLISRMKVMINDLATTIINEFVKQFISYGKIDFSSNIKNNKLKDVEKVFPEIYKIDHSKLNSLSNQEINKYLDSINKLDWYDKMFTIDGPNSNEIIDQYNKITSIVFGEKYLGSNDINFGNDTGYIITYNDMPLFKLDLEDFYNYLIENNIINNNGVYNDVIENPVNSTENFNKFINALANDSDLWFRLFSDTSSNFNIDQYLTNISNRIEFTKSSSNANIIPWLTKTNFSESNGFKFTLGVKKNLEFPSLFLFDENYRAFDIQSPNSNLEDELPEEDYGLERIPNPNGILQALHYYNKQLISRAKNNKLESISNKLIYDPNDIIILYNKPTENEFKNNIFKEINFGKYLVKNDLFNEGLWSNQVILYYDNKTLNDAIKRLIAVEPAKEIVIINDYLQPVSIQKLINDSDFSSDGKFNPYEVVMQNIINAIDVYSDKNYVYMKTSTKKELVKNEINVLYCLDMKKYLKDIDEEILYFVKYQDMYNYLYDYIDMNSKKLSYNN